MNSIESSPPLIKHNVTIVTRLRAPIIPEKEKLVQKNISKEKQNSKSINKSINSKSNSNSRNKQILNGDSKSLKYKIKANQINLIIIQKKG